jgi:hypothetical protein
MKTYFEDGICDFSVDGVLPEVVYIFLAGVDVLCGDDVLYGVDGHVLGCSGGVYDSHHHRHHHHHHHRRRRRRRHRHRHRHRHSSSFYEQF